MVLGPKIDERRTYVLPLSKRPVLYYITVTVPVHTVPGTNGMIPVLLRLLFITQCITPYVVVPYLCKKTHDWPAWLTDYQFLRETSPCIFFSPCSNGSMVVWISYSAIVVARDMTVALFHADIGNLLQTLCLCCSLLFVVLEPGRRLPCHGFFCAAVCCRRPHQVWT